MDATKARAHSTRRRAIVGAIADKLYESLNGSYPFRSSVQSVEPRLRFWDEVQDFPAIQVGAGQETREYEGGGFRFRFLRITIRCYVNDNDDVILALEELLEDVETVLEDNDPLTYPRFNRRRLILLLRPQSYRLIQTKAFWSLSVSEKSS